MSVCLYICTYRSFEEEGKARLALTECLSHGLIEPYSVLYEKEGECMRWVVECKSGASYVWLGTCAAAVPILTGEYVAQFRYTVLLMPNGPVR